VRTRLPWTLVLARRKFRALLAQESFDAVICHTSWVHAIFGPLIRERGIPLVHYIHNPVTTRGFHDRWAGKTPPDLVIAVSKDTESSVRRLFPGSTTEHFYCPMPRPVSDYVSPARAELRAALGCPHGGVVILQASRLDRWKGHEFHVRALGQLRDLPSWVCWIAGGAQRSEEITYLRELEGLARELGIADRVRFLGHRDDIPRLLASADILCQANTGSEGFSIAFLEAASAGLPIVTTAIGGGMEMVENDRTGHLSPVGDVPSIAGALRDLIQDPERRKRMGLASRARAIALCDPPTQMKNFARILSSIRRPARSP
jgi:glycosyltransferase involved in cell wall biosynthesis